MPMLDNVMLYFNTIRYMKPSQVYYRLIKKVGLCCTVGCVPVGHYRNVVLIRTPEGLDFDPKFLNRFDADELCHNKVTFLYSSKEFDWTGQWEVKDRSALWNFNLHYFEYLFSMISAYRRTHIRAYLDQTISCIRFWIAKNPKGKGVGWSPYTIAVRLTNWINYYAAVEHELSEEFRSAMLDSIYEQYFYLAKHVEKDVLGNHYFEDLKTLILCSIFFGDEYMLNASLKAFVMECKEEILPDGMHFELSPTYHKLVLEGLLRVVVALKGIGKEVPELENAIQPMLDAAWSIEGGLTRIPLFNDCGDNVAKSLGALSSLCNQEFGLLPHFKSQLKDSGFYIFQWDNWKMIVDAGQPGPAYIPGHAHCDAMSFELFWNGTPILVNCGTYAYQCQERNFFRSTAAHNTVMVNGTEQSQCWGIFRVAKRSFVTVLEVSDTSLTIEMRDWRGQKVTREIVITPQRVHILDRTNDGFLNSFFHFEKSKYLPMLTIDNLKECQYFEMPYAPDYGRKEHAMAVSIKQDKKVAVSIHLDQIV